MAACLMKRLLIVPCQLHCFARCAEPTYCCGAFRLSSAPLTSAQSQPACSQGRTQRLSACCGMSARCRAVADCCCIPSIDCLWLTCPDCVFGGTTWTLTAHTSSVKRLLICLAVALAPLHAIPAQRARCIQLQVWDNCRAFNYEGDEFWKAGAKCEAKFGKLWAAAGLPTHFTAPAELPVVHGGGAAGLADPVPRIKVCSCVVRATSAGDDIPCTQSEQRRACPLSPPFAGCCRGCDCCIGKLKVEGGGCFGLQVKLPGSTPRGGNGGGLKVKLHLGGGDRRGPASDAEARQLGTAVKVQRVHQ